jgi:hypothetical protein
MNIGYVLQVFNQQGIDINADFHTLPSSKVETILELARLDKYRCPRNANGSKARYYFAALQRKHRAETNAARRLPR